MEEEMIKNILVELDIYSWALKLAGSEDKLFRMFREDFEGLMALCAESN